MVLATASAGGGGGVEERVERAGLGRGGGAALARERGEAVHEAGEVDGGGLGLEHRLREQEVDGARLQRVVGPERPAPWLQKVRRRAQHVPFAVAVAVGGGVGGEAARDGRHGHHAGTLEVLHVPVGVDDPYPGTRP